MCVSGGAGGGLGFGMDHGSVRGGGSGLRENNPVGTKCPSLSLSPQPLVKLRKGPLTVVQVKRATLASQVLYNYLILYLI